MTVWSANSPSRSRPATLSGATLISAGALSSGGEYPCAGSKVLLREKAKALRMPVLMERTEKGFRASA